MGYQTRLLFFEKHKLGKDGWSVFGFDLLVRLWYKEVLNIFAPQRLTLGGDIWETYS